jgi:hypothetical protein
MIQAQVARYGLQPSAGAPARANIIKMIVSLQEHLLRDVFRVRRIGDQTNGRAIYHVLVVLHEYLELVCVDHYMPGATRASFYQQNTAK